VKNRPWERKSSSQLKLWENAAEESPVSKFLFEERLEIHTAGAAPDNGSFLAQTALL
jgi:hypothetical protein